MLMFPAGFSNVTLSGKIIYNYIVSDDKEDRMYVIHYNDHDNMHGEHDRMGWI